MLIKFYGDKNDRIIQQVKQILFKANKLPHFLARDFFFFFLGSVRHCGLGAVVVISQFQQTRIRSATRGVVKDNCSWVVVIL